MVSVLPCQNKGDLTLKSPQKINTKGFFSRIES